jgi:hypothetical protein
MIVNQTSKKDLQRDPVQRVINLVSSHASSYH